MGLTFLSIMSTFNVIVEKNHLLVTVVGYIQTFTNNEAQNDEVRFFLMKFVR